MGGRRKKLIDLHSVEHQPIKKPARRQPSREALDDAAREIARLVPANFRDTVLYDVVGAGGASTDSAFKVPPPRLATSAALIDASSMAMGELDSTRIAGFAGLRSGAGAAQGDASHLASLLGYGEGDSDDGDGEMEGSLADAAFPPGGSGRAGDAPDLDDQISSFMSELESSGLLADDNDQQQQQQQQAANGGETAAAAATQQRRSASTPSSPGRANGGKGDDNSGSGGSGGGGGGSEQKVLGEVGGCPSWYEVLDTGSGKAYFWNAATNEVRWDSPTGDGSAPRGGTATATATATTAGAASAATRSNGDADEDSGEARGEGPTPSTSAPGADGDGVSNAEGDDSDGAGGGNARSSSAAAARLGPSSEALLRRLKDLYGKVSGSAGGLLDSLPQLVRIGVELEVRLRDFRRLSAMAAAAGVSSSPAAVETPARTEAGAAAAAAGEAGAAGGGEGSGDGDAQFSWAAYEAYVESVVAQIQEQVAHAGAEPAAVAAAAGRDAAAAAGIDDDDMDMEDGELPSSSPPQSRDGTDGQHAMQLFGQEESIGNGSIAAAAGGGGDGVQPPLPADGHEEAPPLPASGGKDPAAAAALRSSLQRAAYYAAAAGPPSSAAAAAAAAYDPYGSIGSIDGGGALFPAGAAATTADAAAAEAAMAAGPSQSKRREYRADPVRSASPSDASAAVGATISAAPQPAYEQPAAPAAATRPGSTATTTSASSGKRSSAGGSGRSKKSGGGAAAGGGGGGSKGKGTNQLIAKWQAVRSELQAEEEAAAAAAAAAEDPELQAQQRSREIDAWRQRQAASGAAGDNANFEPVSGDWRARVKAARRASKT